MTKTCSSVTLANIELDHSRPVPLHRQLYDGLRRAILGNQLRPGLRLPSTRAMALQFNISRNTVMNAFEQLLGEGYVEGRIGSGTYVARELPEDILRQRARQNSATRNPLTSPLLSSRGKMMADFSPHGSDFKATALRAFRPGWPAFDEFPFKTWQQLLSRHWRRPHRDVFCKRSFPDYVPLQEAIATHLGATRGLRCEPEQILVVTGAQQALDLTARLLLDPGDSIWVENPGYRNASNTLRAAGAHLIPVPIDGQGIDVSAGIKRCPNARLAYVTPSHQFPLGVTMTLSRRLMLLDWAHRSGAWVIEDDYDSEYRYAGPPLAALQGLDQDGRVISLGTFSKVMLPHINLGYMIVPDSLLDSFMAARPITGRRPLIEQAALADFITEGHLARHVRRMRALYIERQDTLLRAGAQQLAGTLDLQRSQGGIHLTGWLPEGIDDRVAEQATAAFGVETSPICDHSIEPLSRGGLVLGYGAFTATEIREGVRRLALALAKLPRRKALAAHQ